MSACVQSRLHRCGPFGLKHQTPRPVSRIIERWSCAVQSERPADRNRADAVRPCATQLTRRATLAAAAIWLLQQQVLPVAARSAESPAKPNELAVSSAVEAVLAKFVERAKAPVLLRLAFHDAGTFDAASRSGGANASIRFELERPENSGLKRGWRVVEAMAAALPEGPAGSVVSYADLIALAGARAVEVCGGPKINLPLGRQDAVAADPAGRMPAETLSAAELRAAFDKKGFSAQELVALSGAHTLGSKGFGDPLDFSNVYYKELLKKPWTDPKNSMASMIGLPTDHVLPEDEECIPYIKQYAADQNLFFRDFGAAYSKLTCLGATWA